MRENTIAVDDSVKPARISFAPVFNVAVPFIDRHLAEGRGDKVAIRGDFGDVTYGRLARRVNRCGNALIDLGLTPGARVLMMIKDSPEFFYVFWGAIKAGFVPVPLNTLLRADDYRFMIEDSGCEAVIYSKEYAAEVEPALKKAATKPKHVLRVKGEGSISALMQQAATGLAPARATAADDCFWLYSSGSTGRPKGVVHSHRDIPVTCVHYAVGVLGIEGDDVCFSAAKLFFAYGLGNAMTFPLWVGATAVLSDQRPSPDMTFSVIEKYRPTMYFGVPTLYAAQLHALEAAQPDLSSLRRYVSAGEALPADVFRLWTQPTGGGMLDGISPPREPPILLSHAPGRVRHDSSGCI